MGPARMSPILRHRWAVGQAESYAMTADRSPSIGIVASEVPWSLDRYSRQMLRAADTHLESPTGQLVPEPSWRLVSTSQSSRELFSRAAWRGRLPHSLRAQEHRKCQDPDSKLSSSAFCGALTHSLPPRYHHHLRCSVRHSADGVALTNKT